MSPLTATQTREQIEDTVRNPVRNAEPVIVHVDLKFAGTEYDPAVLYDALDAAYGNVGSDKDSLAGGTLQFTVRDPGEKATLLTGVVGNDNAIRWTAVDHGADGDEITVALEFSDAVVPTTSVAVVGTDIVVTLRSSDADAGTILATALEVIGAIRASAAASALVDVANEGASTGAGVVTAVAETALDGGEDPA